jgi:putative sigma-54 modulation protein
MNISIVSKHFELTDPIKNHVEQALHGSVDKFHLDILCVKVIISSFEKHGKGFEVELVFQLVGKDGVVIRQSDKDLYAAVDKAIKRVKNALGRHHDKIKSHRVNKRQDMPIVSIDSEDPDDEIVPAGLDIDKPVNIDEALEFFKGSGSMFIVFEDMTNKTRIMYSRKDGKVGLY